jgi:uncharacterized protein
MHLLHPIEMALGMALTMLWNIFWGLNLGFLFSAVIEQRVSKHGMAKLLPDDGPRSLTIAAALGAASSSCSYAAAAMARSMVRQGAAFTAAMAFQFAATNLVLELSVMLVALMGWQFGAAEFIGGPVMIILLAVIFRLTLKRSGIATAVRQAQRNEAGAMEGHAQMSMAKHEGSWRERLFCQRACIGISHSFVMNWSMLWKDILAGVLVAGALAAWVPHRWWQSLFLTDHPLATAIWGAFLGPLIAIVSFTCSVGNVPFASVLWQGGISFGGAVAFIFGDLIIPPILNIYRKYYGTRMAIYLLVTFYVTMVVAALLVEGLFSLLHLVPHGPRRVIVAAGSIQLNYTTILNGIFAVIAFALGMLFVRTGGTKMLRNMQQEAHSP